MNTYNYLLQLIWFIIIFILIVAAAYFITKFISKSSYIHTKTNNMEILDFISLGKDKGLYIIRVGSEYLLIGATNGNINYLKSINKSEISIVAKDKIDFQQTLNFSIQKIKKYTNRYIGKKDGEKK